MKNSTQKVREFQQDIFYRGMLYELGKEIPEESNPEFQKGRTHIQENRGRSDFSEEHWRKTIERRLNTVDEKMKGVRDGIIHLPYQQTNDKYLKGYKWALELINPTPRNPRLSW